MLEALPLMQYHVFQTGESEETLFIVRDPHSVGAIVVKLADSVIGRIPDLFVVVLRLCVISCTYIVYYMYIHCIHCILYVHTLHTVVVGFHITVIRN